MSTTESSKDPSGPHDGPSTGCQYPEDLTVGGMNDPAAKLKDSSIRKRKSKDINGPTKKCTKSNKQETILTKDSNEDDQYCEVDEYATDCARRQLRKEQRKALEDVRHDDWMGTSTTTTETKSSKKAGNIDLEAFKKERKRNNELFERVRFPRELKLDADILSARANKVNVSLAQTQTYDPLKFAGKLKGKLTQTTDPPTDKEGSKPIFDWVKLGGAAGACFKAVPSRVTFLQGPLASTREDKARRSPVRHADIVDEPLEEQVVASSAKEDSSTVDPAAPLDVLKVELQKQCAAAEAGEIDMIPFLVNPKSFTQTVENFFQFSHLVTRGLAGVRNHAKDGTMYIWFIPEKTKAEGSGEIHPARQLVMPLTLSDWEELVDAYDLHDYQGGLPHRDYSSCLNVHVAADETEDEAEEDTDPQPKHSATTRETDTSS